MPNLETPKVLKQWRALRRWPAGGRLFGWLIGRVVPYAGTVHPRVRHLEPGVAEVTMSDRRGVRNHLRSVHAVATANLGEIAGNLALMSLQPPKTRWIVTGITARYGKKARGVLVARCEVPPLDWSVEGEHDGRVEVRDQSGDVVTTLDVSWRLGPSASAS